MPSGLILCRAIFCIWLTGPPSSGTIFPLSTFLMTSGEVDMPELVSVRTISAPYVTGWGLAENKAVSPGK